MKEWWHALTPGLVSILIKAITFVKKTGVNEFHVHKDLLLNHFEASNFQKLRFHGLVAHADPDARRNGKWLITKRGGEFLRNEIAVPKKVKTFRNKVLEHSEELVKIGDFLGKVPWYEQDFAFEIHDGKVTPLKQKYEKQTPISSAPVTHDVVNTSGQPARQQVSTGGTLW